MLRPGREDWPPTPVSRTSICRASTATARTEAGSTCTISTGALPSSPAERSASAAASPPASRRRGATSPSSTSMSPARRKRQRWFRPRAAGPWHSPSMSPMARPWRRPAQVRATLGPVDIAVNNAAITGVGRVVDLEPAAWRRMFAINTDSVFHVAQAVLPDMIARRGGKIVKHRLLVRQDRQAELRRLFRLQGGGHRFHPVSRRRGSRRSASTSMPFAPARSSARGCARTPTDVARAGTAHRPGARAHLIPLGRVGEPDDIARVVAFLASDEASYMTGQAINVTGGLWMN